MTTAARIFLARLNGIGVFDRTGDQLGKVRDTVATLRLGRQPPRILGLVVEIQHRHRIFVPMGRVTSLENDAVVLTSGIVNMKRFERRTGELLVVADMLDRSVTITDDGRSVTVVDVAMEQNRARDWVIMRLAVAPAAAESGAAASCSRSAGTRSTGCPPSRPDRAPSRCWPCWPACARPTWPSPCRR